MVDNDESNLYLPLKLRPYTDVTSKFIMKDKTVKNIIVVSGYALLKNK